MASAKKSDDSIGQRCPHGSCVCPVLSIPAPLRSILLCRLRTQTRQAVRSIRRGELFLASSAGRDGGIHVCFSSGGRRTNVVFFGGGGEKGPYGGREVSLGRPLFTRKYVFRGAPSVPYVRAKSIRIFPRCLLFHSRVCVFVSESTTDLPKGLFKGRCNVGTCSDSCRHR